MPLFLGLGLPASSVAQQGLAVRDSAGVRIVEHRELGRAPAPFRVGDRPWLDLAGLRDDPREEIDPRNPFLVARPLTDGRWVVVDRTALKIFDHVGRHVRTIGRSGSGPGEFHQLRDVCVGPGDTLSAVTFSERRISTFDSAGNHVRTTMVDGLFGRDPCFPDGTLLLRGPGTTAPGSRLPPRQAALLDRVTPVDRIRWNGEVVAHLGLMPDESFDQTFTTVPSIAAAGDRILVGTGAEPEIRVYDTSGALVQVVRWQVERTRITPDMRRSAIERGYPGGPVASGHLPVYFVIVPAPEGAIWVREYPGVPPRQVGYMVFDRVGQFTGWVHPPTLSRRPVEVVWVGRDRVLLAWRDEDGGPHLTLHPLTAR